LNSSDIDLSSAYAKLLRGWHWVLAGGVAGGLAGIALLALVPGRYHSTARISIGIDYGRTQFIDEDAERHIIFRIQDLLLSDTVLDAAQGMLVESVSGDALAAESDLRERIELHRIEAEWQLSVLARSPELAATSANAWAEAGLSAVEEAASHAAVVAELQRVYFRVACRPGEDPLLGAVWVCDEFDPSGPSPELDSQLLAEIQASHGIPPAVSSGWIQRAEPPAGPTPDWRPLWGVSGTLIGLLLGASLLLVRKPGRESASNG
jgi:hypothetical protein